MRRKTIRGSALAGSVGFALGVTLVPALAHGSGHGAKNCGSTQYVATRSTSAGDTNHNKKIGSTWYSAYWYVLPSGNPDREWAGPNLPSVVADWGVTATVLEAHSAVCKLKPQ